MNDASNPLAFLMLPANRRWLAIVLVAVCAAGVWAVSRWASEPTYAPICRGLELKDVASVTDGLLKNGIRYRLDGGGTDVLVPVADVARARVALAKQGLPASGRPGLELFDKPSWGMTDFTQRVTFQRALEGELARTIGSLRGIDRAEVHLVLPAPSAVRKLEHGAGASVVLTLKQGAALSPETVQGITYIVSNSVEQLSPDNVAVMDDAGRVLTVPSTDGSGAGLTTRQLEVQRSVEHQLASKVEDLLATTLGLGRARAQVAAKLSFDQVDRTVDSFDPDGQVLETEQRSEAPSADGGSGQTIVSNAYQNSRKVEKVTTAVGTVQKLSVSVLVDQKALAAAGARSLSIEKIQAMVANAIGVDSTRGDRLSVEAVPFEPVAKADDTKPLKAPAIDVGVVAERVSRPLVGLVAIGVIVLLALRVLKGGRIEPLPAPADGAAPQLDRPGQPAELAALRARLQSGNWERPELAAQVLRNWLTEAE